MTRVAIGAIMKQEAPYILEWVAYHTALGFEIIIADHGGTDDTSKILTALHNAKVITRIDFRFKKTAPQIPAYRAILRLARIKGIEIIGFLDCDEFFTKDIPIQSLSPASGAEQIASEFKRLNAIQISYNWLAYGSKTDCNDLSLPVLERFPYHAKFETESRSRSFKSFVLLRKVFRFSNIFLLGPQVFSPHYSYRGDKRWYLDEELMQKRDFLNQDRTYINGAILHYQVKTWEEFQRKITRGDAHLPRTRFSITRFQENDLNDLKSEVDENMIIQVKTGIDNLRKLIGDYASVNTATGFFENFYTNLLAIGLSDFQNHKLVHTVYKFVRKFRNTRLIKIFHIN